MSVGAPGLGGFQCSLHIAERSGIHQSVSSKSILASGWKEKTHNTAVDCLPALVLVITDGLQEHLSVLGQKHVLAGDELVAGLVVWFDGKSSGEGGIHRVHVNIHCLRGEHLERTM